MSHRFGLYATRLISRLVGAQQQMRALLPFASFETIALNTKFVRQFKEG
jgi:hypothetical protein